MANHPFTQPAQQQTRPARYPHPLNTYSFTEPSAHPHAHPTNNTQHQHLTKICTSTLTKHPPKIIHLEDGYDKVPLWARWESCRCFAESNKRAKCPPLKKHRKPKSHPKRAKGHQKETKGRPKYITKSIFVKAYKMMREWMPAPLNFGNSFHQ